MTIPLETGSCEYMIVRGAKALDPVCAIFRDAGPQCGELTVTCYGRAWTAYWGAMGDQTVKEFVHSCGRDYICNKLTDYTRKQTKSDGEYLERIVTALKEALEHQAVSVAA
jgi:hypothetical protein